MICKNKNPDLKRFEILSEDSPFAFSEAFNSLRTNFNFAALNGEYKKIVVTSTHQNEGKTCVAINLAISLAANGLRVLLIDCDMRNPSVHRRLRVKRPHNTGLSSVLGGDSTLENSLFKTSRGITVFLGGAVPPNPVEMLSSKTMSDMMDVLSQHYDYIICDAPPVGLVTDAAVLSSICDGVLFIIKQKDATKKQVHNAINNLKAVDANILGIVLNQYDIKEDATNGYGYYRNYHYYRKYGDQ